VSLADHDRRDLPPSLTANRQPTHITIEEIT